MQELIEHILTEGQIPYECKDIYIHTHNPFQEDQIKSCQIFYDDGTLKIFNGVISGKNRLTIKEWSFLLGYGDSYVEYMLKKNEIPIYRFNEYKTLLQKKALGEYFNFKTFNSLKKELMCLYLKESDILGTRNPKPLINSLKYKKKSRRKKSSIEEVELSPNDKEKVESYMKSRLIPTTDKSYPVTLSMNGVFNLNALCILYPNGFKKYRLINSNSLKYMSSGSYQCLFDWRVNNTKTLLILEGEIEAISLTNIVDCDLSALHNVNSVKNNKELSSYGKIVVFLDNDKFDEVKDKVREDLESHYSGNLIMLPKFKSNDKSLDFNSYLINQGEKELKKYIKNYLTANNICDTIVK